uniref:Uncharacterized protein n=1 Tax=Rhipicephalus microplus TaxID=6941 RepID=A0A6G4ZYJ3_RHIMP
MHENRKNQSKLKKSVKTVLAAYGLKAWPVVNENNVHGNKNYKQILRKTGPRPLFDYFVSSEGPYPIITMTKPEQFFVSEANVGFREASLFARSDEGEEVTDQYDGYEDIYEKVDEAYENFIEKALELLNDTLKDQKTNISKSIINFEKKLYNLTSQARPAKTTNETFKLSPGP